MLTSGIVIEKKGVQETYLKAKESSKFLISSNTILKGPGGARQILEGGISLKLPIIIMKTISQRMISETSFLMSGIRKNGIILIFS